MLSRLNAPSEVSILPTGLGNHYTSSSRHLIPPGRRRFPYNHSVSSSSDCYGDDFMRGRIIGKIEEGREITDVAREFDIAHSVVSRLWKSFKTTGMCSRRHGEGRVRSTTPAEDRYIVLSAKRNRRTTAQQVANQFLDASGKQMSRKTVARRLRGGGLYARRPVVCVPLTRQHHTARL
ncbi:HTH_Tnp_Tc3_2 domain-containing protein [Trichonephila clavipes]|uniref:HTH_Tnp_Tc3_2 domain-containing protein n=1 Tax=Trichonephila clavipes TaxID=2585209 RepID=A0A8X7BJA1_TRICX|nr:HTH_Tnp_Tc3_2 domain-containing protein [Trichonephila clavipes]